MPEMNECVNVDNRQLGNSGC